MIVQNHDYMPNPPDMRRHTLLTTKPILVGAPTCVPHSVAVPVVVAILSTAHCISPSFAQESQDIRAPLEEAQRRVHVLEAENARLREQVECLTSVRKKVRLVHDHALRPDERSVFARIDQAVAESRTYGRTWLMLMYQWDTREFNTLNIEGSAPLPLGFNVWGFVDFMTPLEDANANEDVSDFFYEIDLKRKVLWDWGVMLEVNEQDGTDNTVGRAGVFWEPKFQFLDDIKLWFQLKAFPYETDHNGGQVALAWNKRFPEFLEGRFSMGGFFDVNLDSGPDDDATNIVSETQVRFRLIEGLHFVTEFDLFQSK